MLPLDKVARQIPNSIPRLLADDLLGAVTGEDPVGALMEVFDEI